MGHGERYLSPAGEAAKTVAPVVGQPGGGRVTRTLILWPKKRLELRPRPPQGVKK
jgi:hypothetical protein